MANRSADCEVRSIGNPCNLYLYLQHRKRSGSSRFIVADGETWELSDFPTCSSEKDSVSDHESFADKKLVICKQTWGARPPAP
jgi:hypothetical protein